METANTNIPQTVMPAPYAAQYSSPPPSPGMQFKDFLIIILLIALILSILGINIFIGFGNLIQYISNLLRPLLAFLGYSTGKVINTTADLTSDTAKFGIDVAEGTVQNIGNLFIAASGKDSIPEFKQQYNKYSAALVDNVSKAISTNPIKISAPPVSPPIQAPAQSPTQAPIQAPASTPAPIAVPVPVPVPISVPTPARTFDATINTPPPKYMKEVSADGASSNIQTTPIAKKANWCLIGEYKDRRGCVEIDDADRCISGQIFPSQQMCLNPTFNQASDHTYIFNDTTTQYEATSDRTIASNQIFYT